MSFKFKTKWKLVLIISVFLVQCNKDEEVTPGSGQVIFTEYGIDENDLNLVIINADGSGKTTLLAEGVNVAESAAIDGKFAYSTGTMDDLNSIALYDLSGNTSTILHTDLSKFLFRASLSPAKDKVLFNDDGYIGIVNANGTNYQRLSLLDIGESHPVFSADGSKILFTMANDPADYLYSINANGSGLKLLDSTARIAYDFYGRIDCNRNDKVIFVRDVDPGDYSELVVVNVDGSGKSVIFSDVEFKLDNPVWSADGTKIAFEVYNEFFDDIYVINANGTGLTNITNSAAGRSYYLPQWSGDGSKILTYNADDVNEYLSVIDLSSLQKTDLSNKAAFAGFWVK